MDSKDCHARLRKKPSRRRNVSDQARLPKGYIVKKAFFSAFLLSSTAFAGAVEGPQHHRDVVRAGQTDVYVLVFEGEETAMITVRGDGSTDLDCRVYDQGNHLVESDTDSTDTCYLRWTPAWTGKFKLKITNVGRISNIYVVDTN